MARTLRKHGSHPKQHHRHDNISAQLVHENTQAELATLWWQEVGTLRKGATIALVAGLGASMLGRRSTVSASCGFWRRMAADPSRARRSD